METAKLIEKLERAIEKLKDARKEIHEAVLTALELKEKSNDIADQVMIAMAALAVDDFEAYAAQLEKEKAALTRRRAA